MLVTQHEYAALGLQDDQCLPTSTPASSSGDQLGREGEGATTASVTSAAASTASSAASDGPEHLESAHWQFEAPNLILDPKTGKAGSIRMLHVYASDGAVLRLAMAKSQLLVVCRNLQ